MRNSWLVIGGVSGALAVAMGAYGAHGLSSTLLSLGFTEEAVAMRIDERYEPAVLYHLVHSVALLLVGGLADARPGAAVRIAGGAFLAGILLFSGLLYVLTFGDYTGLGAVVPVGGVAYIVGWLALALSGGMRTGGR